MRVFSISTFQQPSPAQPRPTQLPAPRPACSSTSGCLRRAYSSCQDTNTKFVLTSLVLKSQKNCAINLGRGWRFVQPIAGHRGRMIWLVDKVQGWIIMRFMDCRFFYSHSLFLYHPHSTFQPVPPVPSGVFPMIYDFWGCGCQRLQEGAPKWSGSWTKSWRHPWLHSISAWYVSARYAGLLSLWDLI